MGKKIFVTNNALPKRSVDSTFQTGAAIAGGDFLGFLIDQGRLFDELHFVHLEGRQLERQGFQAGAKGRLVDIHEFPALAQSYQEGVLFTSLSTGAYLRRAFTQAAMPVVWQGHSAGYMTGGIEPLLDLISDIRPYDCALAGSRAHADALRNLYERTASECTPLLAGIGGGRPPRIEVLPVGVDTEVFHPGDRRAARRSLGLPEDGIVFLSMSRITFSDKMDFLPLLRGFRAAAGERADITLVIAGGNSGANNHVDVLKELARSLGLPEGRVRILAGVPGGQVADVYRAADVFLSMNDATQETFCLTAVEAMATGLPVVVSDWDGLRDTVLEGETGFRIRTLWGKAQQHAEAIRPFTPWMYSHLFIGQTVAVDVEEFYRRAMRLADDGELRCRMGEAARVRAVAEYDWRRIVPRYEALFAELMAEAATAPDRDPARRGLDFLRPDYHSVFRSYPSESLLPDTCFGRTDSGDAVLDGTERMLVYGSLVVELRPRVLRELVADLDHPRTYREIAARSSLPAEALAFHLLWLAKHGYLATGCPLPAAEEATIACAR